MNTKFVTNFTPSIFTGLVLSGLLAAIMSTGSAFVTLGVASLIREMAFNKKVKIELLLNRSDVLGLLVLSLLFSFYMGMLLPYLAYFVGAHLPPQSSC